MFRQLPCIDIPRIHELLPLLWHIPDIERTPNILTVIMSTGSPHLKFWIHLSRSTEMKRGTHIPEKPVIETIHSKRLSKLWKYPLVNLLAQCLSIAICNLFIHNHRLRYLSDSFDIVLKFLRIFWDKEFFSGFYEHICSISSLCLKILAEKTIESQNIIIIVNSLFTGNSINRITRFNNV